MSIEQPLTNREIAELLARRGDETEGPRRRAYRRSSEAAFVWHEEAADLLGEGRPLTDLPYIGDRLAARIEGWITDAPQPIEPPPSRRGFVTLTDVMRVLTDAPYQPSDLKGDLQMHTVYSDGLETVGSMAAATAARGFEYIAITDHSSGQRIPRGMTPEELELQTNEIAKLNKGNANIRLLRSIEMNLFADGSGALTASELKRFEIVVGSFHAALQSTDDETHRYVTALRNPCVDIIGHPRGRMFNRRAGLNADWDVVFQTALDEDKALEINSNPARQDLQVELLQGAREAGIKLSIGTDSHSIPELDWVVFAVGSAVMAGIPKEQIINFLPVEQLLEWRAGHGR
jgi:histidinol phosphatase-like PHP family hydrolase